MARRGGGLPKYNGLGDSWIWSGTAPYNENIPRVGADALLPYQKNWNNPNSVLERLNNLQQPITKSSISAPLSNIKSEPTFVGRDFGIEGTNKYSDNIPTLSLSEADIAAGRAGGGYSDEGTPLFLGQKNQEGTTSPYGGMGWEETALAAAPGVISGLSNLFLRKSMKNKLQRLSLPEMQAQQINLENERAAAREQANVARANVSRGLRGVAPSAGGYMANMIAGETGIQRGLGQQLGQSYQNEAVTNAQMRQQAAMANQE